MKDVLESPDYYVIDVFGTGVENRDSDEVVEIADNIFAVFRRGKRAGSKTRLVSLWFSKDLYSRNAVKDFWSDYDIRWIPKRMADQKVPIFDGFAETKDAYVCACLRNTPESDTVTEQIHLIKQSRKDKDDLDEEAETVAELLDDFINEYGSDVFAELYDGAVCVNCDIGQLYPETRRQAIFELAFPGVAHGAVLVLSVGESEMAILGRHDGEIKFVTKDQIREMLNDSGYEILATLPVVTPGGHNPTGVLS